MINCDLLSSPPNSNTPDANENFKLVNVDKGRWNIMRLLISKKPMEPFYNLYGSMDHISWNTNTSHILTM
jgi:hypothetical protein